MVTVLDERLVISYLARMATRLLLTLLALLTGLAAQLSPAQARIRAEGASAVGAFASFAQSERAAVARPAMPSRPTARRWSPGRCTVPMLHDQVECEAPVMLGIDRARN